MECEHTRRAHQPAIGRSVTDPTQEQRVIVRAYTTEPEICQWGFQKTALFVNAISQDERSADSRRGRFHFHRPTSTPGLAERP